LQFRKSQIALAALAAQATPAVSGNKYQATDPRSFAQQNQ